MLDSQPIPLSLHDRKTPERKFPTEIRLPEAVKQEALKGTVNILSKIGTAEQNDHTFKIKENGPNVILVLMRSAQLPMETVRAYLDSHQIEGELPPIIEVGIGKAGLSIFFCDHHNEHGNDNDEEDDDILNLQNPNYQQWLEASDNKIVQNIIKQLQNGNPHNIRRVLAVDDAASSNITLEKTLPPIVAQAYGKDVSIDTALEFANPLSKDIGWEYAIVDENFPGISSGERYFLHELIKGSLDKRVLEREAEFSRTTEEQKEYMHELKRLSELYEGDFIPITDEGALKLLAYHTKSYTHNEQGVSAVDLYQSLIKNFGCDYLLGLPAYIERTFRELSKEVKL